MAPTLVLGSDTVGALRAIDDPESAWMRIPVEDVAGWVRAIEQLMALTTAERTHWLDRSQTWADRYSLAAHVESALALMKLPLRPRPLAPVGWLARAWPGRVVVW